MKGGGVWNEPSVCQKLVKCGGVNLTSAKEPTGCMKVGACLIVKLIEII